MRAKVFAAPAQIAGLALLSLQAAAIELPPVGDAQLQAPADADWLMWRRTLDSHGYSPLDQIDRDNVENLALAWSRPLAAGSPQEGTPLVYRGVMFMPNPRDVIQAIDAATGDLLWEYRRQLPDDIDARFPFAATNRNIAIFDSLLIDTSVDNYVYAVDINSGELAWETRIFDYREQPATHSSGPIIAGGKVISGRGCLRQGSPDTCVITAHDARTGKELWRTGTIQRAGEADDSWGGLPDEQRAHVGSWMVPSYDPELNLVFVGTSVTAPAPKVLLAGTEHQYLYHNSTLALDADSGEIVWHYQHLVDHWDLDHVFERLLLDTEVTPDPDVVPWINPRLKPGERRRVITGIPGKTGLVYTLDRATGEFLWARPTVYQNVVERVDGASGRVELNSEAIFTARGDTRLVCPGMSGGKNWPAGTYSPDAGAMFFPLQNLCMEATVITEAPPPGLPVPAELYGVMPRMQAAPGTDQLGAVWAIDVATGRTLWTYEQRAPTLSLVATGGGLVFGGDAKGRFRAFDDTDGEVLWETQLGSQVSGFPVTYEADGRQYVAVSTGGSLSPGSLLTLTPELKPGTANNLFVFALPRRGPMPASRWQAPPPQPESGNASEVAAAALRSAGDGVFTAAQARAGQQLFARHCASCHTAALTGGPATPPIVGQAFRLRWEGRRLGQLHRSLVTTMPPGGAGSLTRAEYAQLLAYILERNGFPAGEKGELPVDPAEVDDVELSWRTSVP